MQREEVFDWFQKRLNRPPEAFDVYKVWVDLPVIENANGKKDLAIILLHLEFECALLFKSGIFLNHLSQLIKLHNRLQKSFISSEHTQGRSCAFNSTWRFRERH